MEVSAGFYQGFFARLRLTVQGPSRVDKFVFWEAFPFHVGVELPELPALFFCL